MIYGHVTVRGCKSSFKDWAAENTALPNIVSEKALGHRIPDKVEQAYRRVLLQKRKALMAQWARYCEQPAKGGEVIKIAKAA